MHRPCCINETSELPAQFQTVVVEAHVLLYLLKDGQEHDLARPGWRDDSSRQTEPQIEKNNLSPQTPCVLKGGARLVEGEERASLWRPQTRLVTHWRNITGKESPYQQIHPTAVIWNMKCSFVRTS